MSTARLVIVAFALLAAACSASAIGPPEVVVDRTVCSHCGMYVSEPIYAAAYRLPGGEARVFDDLGCMRDALRRETATVAGAWVQDAAGAGWLDADEAFFVASPQLRTPMSGGLLAWADAAAAEQAAAKQGGRVMRSFAELIAWNGETR